MNLQLFIIIIFAMIIIAFVSVLMKKMGKSRVRWFFGGYMSILLIGVILTTVLPTSDMAQMKIVSEHNLEKENTALYNAAIEGKINKVNKKFIAKRWKFDYHNTNLNITVENHEPLNTEIVVERKKTNDGKIDAVYYKTRSSINGLEVTSMSNPAVVKLSGNNLLVKQSIVKIKFSQFENIFSINQFTGGNWFSHRSNFVDGQNILYLRIPKNLELNNQTDLNLEFIK